MEPLKNNISQELAFCLANHLERHLDGFDRHSFEAAILKDLPGLELKQRAQLIADQLHRVMPSDLAARYRIIRAMLHPDEDVRMDLQSSAQGIRGWGMLPLGMVVGQHGLADFNGSLGLLKEMTTRFSSEFDVRHYLIADQERGLHIMGSWVMDPSHHVRRLVSEGTRPRLPWAMRLPSLIANPRPILPLLGALRDDPAEYVRLSVSNNLNDIAKDHPDLVASIAQDWMKGADGQRQRLLRHACRTLIKQGHPATLDVFGLRPPQVEIIQLSIEADVVLFGGALIFAVELRSTSESAQSLVIDYVLHFAKGNGGRVGKVFKWKNLTLPAGQILALHRSHPIRPISTRRYYEGRQALSLRVNGQDMGLVEFVLKFDR
jgi:3-methyladenine DNA glycosylase AlkC